MRAWARQQRRITARAGNIFTRGLVGDDEPTDDADGGAGGEDYEDMQLQLALHPCPYFHTEVVEEEGEEPVLRTEMRKDFMPGRYMGGTPLQLSFEVEVENCDDKPFEFQVAAVGEFETMDQEDRLYGPHVRGLGLWTQYSLDQSMPGTPFVDQDHDEYFGVSVPEGAPCKQLCEPALRRQPGGSDCAAMCPLCCTAMCPAMAWSAWPRTRCRALQ